MNFALAAVRDVGRRIAGYRGGSSSEGFRAVYHDNMTFGWCGPNECSGFGYTKSGSEILFKCFYEDETRNTSLVVHELGHAFDYMVCGNTDGCINDPGSARAGLTGRMGTDLPKKLDGSTGLGRPDYDGPKPGICYGFAGGQDEWQFAYSNKETPGEVFADMFLGWEYAEWGNDEFGYGTNRQYYMDTNMPLLITPSCYQRKLRLQARTNKATFSSKPAAVTE